MFRQSIVQVLAAAFVAAVADARIFNQQRVTAKVEEFQSKFKEMMYGSSSNQQDFRMMKERDFNNVYLE